MHIAKYYTKKNGKILCKLCPHNCRIKENERGTCGARKNINGELYSMVYGKPVSVSIDPVEKKPLYHFRPGQKTYSIGTTGCNMKCKFCQNWAISQKNEEEVATMNLPPKKVVEEAKRRKINNIAYTYNEPTIFMEYMQDTAKLAHEEGMKNIEVTCGMVNEEPLKDLLPYLDAANIDLKYFSNKLYQEISGGYLEPVLRTIKQLKKKGVWIEITNLLIPELNDDEEMIQEMCEWIVNNVGKDVPLHFSKFHPTYKMQEKPPTPTETLKKAEQTAKNEGINYVYLGNIHEETNTTCSECGEVLIKRSGFTMSIRRMKKNKCENCGHEVPGVWE